MLPLSLAVAVFLLTHFVSSTPLRAALVARIGEKPYLGLYSLVAAACIVAMVYAYTRAPKEMLWNPDPVLHYLPVAVMPLVLVLLVAGLTSKNPTNVGMDRLLRDRDVVRGILRVTRHPVQWAILLWSAVHILANGDSASVVFFGGFFVLSAVGTRLIDRKKAAALGQDWARFAAVTSNLPFAAIASGRNRFVWSEIGGWRIALAALVYLGLIAVHPYLFGVSAH